MKYILRPKRKKISMPPGELIEMTIRSALFYILTLFSASMYSIFSALFFWLPLKIRYPLIFIWPKVCVWTIVHVLQIKFRIENPENLKKALPCIFVSNHHSACETIILSAVLAYPASFVLKREFIYHPLLGPAIFATGLIPINRKGGAKGRKKVIEAGKKRLSQGFNIVLFPEGTRMPPGIRAQYKTGAMELAFYSGRPIVPIAQNSGLLWPRLSFLKKKGMVTFVVGEPIYTEGKTPKEVKTEIQRWTHGQLDRIESQHHRTHHREDVQ